MREIKKTDPARFAQVQEKLLNTFDRVFTPAYLERLARADPYKFLDTMARYVPIKVIGAGEDGEHVLKIIHAVPPSPLDDVSIPGEVTGRHDG